MGYNGYLIKVGTYEIPMKFIALEGYKVTPNMRQDLDPFRDNNGVLTRNVVTNMPSKIEFNTPYLFRKDMQTLMTNIRSQFTNSAEKKASVTFFCEDIDDYKTEDMYIPDVPFEMYHRNADSFDLSLYKPTTIKFIGY